MGLSSFLKRVRRWRAVAWIPTDTLSEDGERTYSAPVEIKCRWEHYDGEEVDAAGKAFRAKGRVFVDRDLPIGTILRRPLNQVSQRAGVALAALTAATGAGPHDEETVFQNAETYKVRKREDIPFFRPNTNSHRTVVLSGRND